MTTADSYWYARKKVDTFYQLNQVSERKNPMGPTNGIFIISSQDKQSIERRSYNILDWANEVGGFYGFIELIIQIVLPYCQVWSLEKTLISKLYKSKRAGFKRAQDPAVDAQEALSSQRDLLPLQEFPLTAWLKD